MAPKQLSNQAWAEHIERAKREQAFVDALSLESRRVIWEEGFNWITARQLWAAERKKARRGS